MTAEIKQAVRREMRKRLNQLSQETINQESSVVTQRLFQMKEYQSARHISVYISKENAPEISTKEIIKHILSTGRSCYIPRCVTDTKMEMVKLKDMADYLSLPKNKMNIAEPRLDEGLAFDKKGWRMGHGRGYYDRFLEACDTYNSKHGGFTHTIALALSSQIRDTDIPRDQYDRKPGMLLTPTELIL
ncbi:hypothetical protein HDV05_006306 [Chytridiales sp. JEL 0842]|nr:hypothetical protein HDV05_006306 [Chytridiales sp. JEL 0842]